MDKVKILFIIDNLGAGGAQNQLTLLVRALDHKSYNITLLTYYPQDFYIHRLKGTHIKQIQLHKKGTLGIGIIYSIIKLINRNKYSHIISFLDTPNFYNVLAGWLSKQKSKNIISYRSKTEMTKMKWWNKKIKEWVNRRATYIVSNSHHERMRWQEHYPKQAYKWRTIYNAIDPEMTTVNNSKKNEFLVVGSIGPDKNALLIVEAIHLLNQSHQAMPITWIGQSFSAQKKYAEYHQEILQKIDEYELQAIWHWQEPTTEISQEYSKYKALILASTTEGLPNVVCEALYCGLPCIVSNVLDHPRIVQEGKTGYLFDPYDAVALSNTLLKMHTIAPNQYEIMCQNAQEQGRELFNINTFIQQYEELLS